MTAKNREWMCCGGHIHWSCSGLNKASGVKHMAHGQKTAHKTNFFGSYHVMFPRSLRIITIDLGLLVMFWLVMNCITGGSPISLTPLLCIKLLAS